MALLPAVNSNQKKRRKMKSGVGVMLACWNEPRKTLWPRKKKKIQWQNQEEDGSKRFLVDFERKTVDKIVEEREKERERDDSVAQTPMQPSDEDKEDVRKLFLKEAVPEPADPDEEWVDYTDSLGRSRRCMKKDLAKLKEMDRDLSGRSDKEKRSSDLSLPDLMSSDMYRERLREKWEKEEREAMEGPAGPVHYANVQHNEIRTHGVGFFQFDKKEGAREQQLKELRELREQTKEKRAAHERLKDKRKAMLAKRLAKVREKKLIREGKDPSEILDKSDESDDDLIGPKPSEKEPEVQPLTRDDSWREKAPVRDWDKGKEDLEEFLKRPAVHSQETWIEKLRDERVEEFAPPSIYGKESFTKEQSKVKRKQEMWKHLSVSQDSQPVLSASDPTPTEQHAHKFPASSRKVIEHRINQIRKQTDRQPSERKEPGAINDLSHIPMPPTAGPSETPSVDVPDNTTNLSTPSDMGGMYYAASHPHNTQTYDPQQRFPASDQMNTGAYAMYQQTYGSGIVVDQGAQYSVPTSQYVSQAQTMVQNVFNSAPVQEHIIESTDSQIQNPQTSEKRAVDQEPSGKSVVPESSAESNTLNSRESSEVTAGSSCSEVVGPQPAHYSSGPMKPQPKKPRYERVNIHELPMSLPVPPTLENVPEYPSQEEIFGPVSQMSDEKAAKHWQKQFGHSGGSKKANSATNKLTPAGIPFPSPYIQSKDKSSKSDPATQFDPCKPPPSVS